MRKYWASVLLGLLLAGSLTGCTETKPVTPPTATSVDRYDLKGVVVSVSAAEKEAVIEHEKIADLMDAMRMAFKVPKAADLDKLQPGKVIKATLVVENGMMWVERVEVTGEAPVPTGADAAGAGHSH